MFGLDDYRVIDWPMSAGSLVLRVTILRLLVKPTTCVIARASIVSMILHGFIHVMAVI